MRKSFTLNPLEYLDDELLIVLPVGARLAVGCGGVVDIDNSLWVKRLSISK